MKKILGIIIGTIIITILGSGCQSENSRSIIGPDNNTATTATLLETDQGTFKVLQIDPDFQSASTQKRGSSYSQYTAPVLSDTLFRRTQHVDASTGGLVLLGDWSYGFSSIYFGPDVLPQSDSIFFEWAPQNSFDGTLCGLLFGPHGLQFNGEAIVTLTYKNANLSGVNQSNLKVAYFNENTGQWEIQVTHVNTWFKTVTVNLRHFSRYALVHG